MSSSRDKWKKIVRQVSSPGRYPLERKSSILSNISMGSVQEEETCKDEVDSYLSRLKEKTGLRGLWSGNKFASVVDDDRTPDISISSDDGDLMHSMNFNRLKLDSDEDEMRIDYMRDKKRDVNNNQIEESDDNEPLDLMGNVHFAELKIGDVVLSDTDNKMDKSEEDFLPNVYTVNFSDDDKTSDTISSPVRFNQNNIKFMSSIDSETDKNHDEDDTIETESILSQKTLPISQTGGSNRSSVGNSQYTSDFSSRDSDKTKTRSRRRRSTNASTTQFLPTHRSSTSRRPSKQRSSKTFTTETLSHSESDTDTLSSTSSLATDSYSFRKSPRSRSRSVSRKTSKLTVLKGNKKNKHHKSIHVQTDYVPSTADVLDFRYPWQQERPRNIASHVVNGETLHVLTSYDPAVLAAHDMMKYHFKLLQQHIENSRRLYEAYTNEPGVSQHKYTTVEDTMKYIKQNKPKVVSYEDALKKVKSEDRNR